MAKLVQIARGIAVNPDHVVSVRGDNEGFYVEMTTGVRHQLVRDMLGVINRLNGGSDENAG